MNCRVHVLAIVLVFLRDSNCVLIESDFSNVGFSSVIGKRLNDTPLTSFETKSWTRCLLSCRYNTQCNSINLSPSTCELMTSQARNDDELQEAAGWYHSCKYQHDPMLIVGGSRQIFSASASSLITVVF